jgi:hypothetical protein
MVDILAEARYSSGMLAQNTSWWTRLWRKMTKRCVHCGTPLKWASTRILMTGDGFKFCPNGHFMEAWALDFMFGDHDHITHQFSDANEIPGWAREQFAVLRDAGIKVNVS